MLFDFSQWPDYVVTGIIAVAIVLASLHLWETATARRWGVAFPKKAATIWETSVRGKVVRYDETIHLRRWGLSIRMWNEEPVEGSEQWMRWKEANGILWQSRCRIISERHMRGTWESRARGGGSNGTYYFIKDPEEPAWIGSSVGWGKDGFLYRDWGVLCEDLKVGTPHMDHLAHGDHQMLNRA